MRPNLNISYFKPERPGVYKRLDGSYVFCFDAVIDDNNHENEYIKISSPSAPLHFEELPDS